MQSKKKLWQFLKIALQVICGCRLRRSKKRKARKSSKGNIKIGSNVEFLDVALYESAIVNIRFKGQKVRELGAAPLSWVNKNQMDTKCNSSKGVEKFFVDFKKISIFAKGMVADNST